MNATDDIISDLLDQVRAELGTEALTPAVSERIEIRMRYTWGGQPVYVKKRDGDARAIAVRKEYNGRNRRELQEKYNLSRAQFYKILKGG